jgi:translation initiation factor IF-3
MTLLISPKPAVMQKVSQMKAAAEKARQQAIKEGRVPLPEPEEEPDLVDDDDDDDDDDEDEVEHDLPAT